MNLVLWVVAGSVFGWIAYTHLSLDKGRSMLVSVLVGAAGALLGGIVVAPHFAEFAPAPGMVGITELFIAMAASAACLALDSLGYRYWGK